MKLANNWLRPDTNGNNILALSSSQWTIDGTAVSASAAALNNASALVPTNAAAVPITWQGIWAANQVGSYSYQQVGKLVTINFAAISATANTGATITNTVDLPAALLPAADVSAIVPVVNSAAKTSALAVISAAGLITIAATVAGGNFTNSGAGGFPSFSISYLTA